MYLNVATGSSKPRLTHLSMVCMSSPFSRVLLDTIRDPEHEGYDEMMEWLGGEFDPEGFDLEGVNQALRRMR